MCHRFDSRTSTVCSIECLIMATPEVDFIIFLSEIQRFQTFQLELRKNTTLRVNLRSIFVLALDIETIHEAVEIID